MHEKILGQALICPRPVVLGLRLLPFSLAHKAQLDAADNPFIKYTPAGIASMSMAEQRAALVSALWVVAEKTPRLSWWWARRHSIADYAVAVVQFSEYMEAARLEFPSELPQNDDSSVRYIGAPEAIRLYSFLCENLPESEIALWGSTAWDFPYAMAKLLYQTHAEQKGGLDIYNQKHLAHDTMVEQGDRARTAWTDAKTDADKLAAIAAHPMILELPDIESDAKALQEKAKPCPTTSPEK